MFVVKLFSFITELFYSYSNIRLDFLLVSNMSTSNLEFINKSVQLASFMY